MVTTWADLRMRVALDMLVADAELTRAVDRWIDIACPRWYIHPGQEWVAFADPRRGMLMHHDPDADVFSTWRLSTPRRAGLSPMGGAVWTMAAIEEFRRSVAEGRLRHQPRPWMVVDQRYSDPVFAEVYPPELGKVMSIDQCGRVFAGDNQDQSSKPGRLADLVDLMRRWTEGLPTGLFAPDVKSVEPQQFPRI